MIDRRRILQGAISTLFLPLVGKFARGATVQQAEPLDLQALIDEAASQGGGIVSLPAGTFETGRLFVPDNITLQGVGWATVIRMADGNDHNLIQNADPLNGNQNIVIRDLAIDGNLTGQTAETNPRHGIGLYNAHHVLVDNVRTFGLFDSVYVGAARIDGITPLDASSHVTVRDCLFEDNERNAVTITRGRHVTVSNCLMRRCCQTVGSGVVAVEGNAATDEMIDIKILGCTFSDNAYWGVRVTGSTGTKRAIVISNNWFDRNLWGVNIASGNVDGVVITNNVLTDTTERGISVRYARGVTVSGNVVNRTSAMLYPAILVGKNASDVAISGNAIQEAKILINDAARVALVGNTLRADTEGIIQVRGTPDVQIVGNVGTLRDDLEEVDTNVPNGTYLQRVVRLCEEPIIE